MDLDTLVDDGDCEPRVKSNALIKRASLKDPVNDPLMAFKDFETAERIDPENADVFHHRGQVNLLTEQIDKAAKDFKRAVELKPDFPVAYVQKLYTDYRQAMQQNNQVR